MMPEQTLLQKLQVLPQLSPSEREELIPKLLKLHISEIKPLVLQLPPKSIELVDKLMDLYLQQKNTTQAGPTPLDHNH